MPSCIDKFYKSESSPFMTTKVSVHINAEKSKCIYYITFTRYNVNQNRTITVSKILLNSKDREDAGAELIIMKIKMI